MVRPKRRRQRAEGIADMKAFAAKARTQREQLPTDPHRPRYHFMPPANWMNDPNGVIEWNGKYHLFYQHNPNDAVWDDMHWGHAVSDDLVHWTDQPIALSPTPGGPDEDGCWSGCAVDNNGLPTVLYTGVQGDWTRPHNQRVCIATGTDDLVQWEKHPANPVIARPPAGMKVTGFRDPSVWREDECWVMAIGAGIQNIGGAVLLYRSSDLINWEYMHPLCLGDKHDTENIWTGSVWEVPQFFPLGDRHVLIFTAWDGEQLYTVYFTGRYREHRFLPEAIHKLDFGDRHFCAPYTMTDSQGRRILWGWIGEDRSVEAQMAAGWSGVLALPRELRLRADGKLAINPVQEINALRGDHYHLSDIDLSADSNDFEIDLRGDALEIAAEIDPASAEECGIKIRCSPDREEETSIFFDTVRKRLGVDRRRSTLLQDSGLSADVQAGAFELSPGEKLRLRIFVDCSAIEVYANDHACITSRVYPSRSDSAGLRVYARGSARVNSVDIWKLRSIWKSS